MTAPTSPDRDSTADADERLAAIVESSFDAIIAKDLNSVVTNWNPAAERLFGYTAEEAVGRSILMLIPENRRAEETDFIERISRGERIDTFETIRVRKDGTLVPVSLTISPIKNARGEIIGASKIARDISAARDSERRIRLLMREVNHRVKNQFAVILSIIRETARQSGSPAEFEDRVRDRIMALSRSHDLLVQSEWSGASMFDLIQGHLEPFGQEAQITLSGPMLTLLPNAVQHLGMAFHELGTNSAKYGALSSDVGHVSVTWQVTMNVAGEQEFSLIWEEVSVPAAGDADAETPRRGFGSVVLQRVTPLALGGRAVVDRSPGHLRWTLAAPLKDVSGVSYEDDAENGAPIPL